MDFRTIIDIQPSTWKIEPRERMLFVGSCFADNMGRRFQQERFCATVNPYGVMYNPASILHTVERLIADNAMPFKADRPGTAIFTLGTNHVYILKATNEIVDNCQKRPQHLFEEHELSIDQCADYLCRAISAINSRFPLVRFILTVSPIRYRKYGYHGSQLSKATLLLAIEKVIAKASPTAAPTASPGPTGASPGPSNGRGVLIPADCSASTAPFPTVQESTPLPLEGPGEAPVGPGEAPVVYFPSYEIVNDELRDYRFYKEDMLHPTEQAVNYIYERMAEAFFSPATHDFLRAWKPIREALAHKPFNPDSEEYKAFLRQAIAREQALMEKYPDL